MDLTIEQLIKETMDSYYEYIGKIEGGSREIVSAVDKEDFATAADYLQALSEGLLWMLETEALLKIHSYHIESPVGEVVPLFEKINAALEQEKLPFVAQILDGEFIPLFKDTKDRQFQKVVSQ